VLTFNAEPIAEPAVHARLQIVHEAIRRDFDAILAHDPSVSPSVQQLWSTLWRFTAVYQRTVLSLRQPSRAVQSVHCALAGHRGL
jgi:hypothetical protein